jgi:hypothetical protein
MGGSYAWLGYLLNQKGERKKALEYIEKGYSIKIAQGDSMGAATTLNNIGAVSLREGSVD